MEILRTNHTRPADHYTEQTQVYPEHTKNFKVACNANGMAVIEARCFEFDWHITLSKEETAQLRQCLLAH
jgi:hypothetical protein